MSKARPCLEHGSVETNNNSAERQMRPVASGRKTGCLPVLKAA
ncbi:MAG: transposase [Pseudomonadota bacterium]